MYFKIADQTLCLALIVQAVIMKTEPFLTDLSFILQTIFYREDDNCWTLLFDDVK